MRTSELAGIQLDDWASRAAGYSAREPDVGPMAGAFPSFSTDWAEAGPITIGMATLDAGWMLKQILACLQHFDILGASSRFCAAPPNQWQALETPA